MSPLGCHAPTTAERIRSACARAGGAILALESWGARQDPVATPVHHLLHDGSFAIAVPVDRAGEADRPLAGSQALLELTDYAPLPLREPVRSLVWVRGRLEQVRPHAVLTLLDQIAAEHPNPALLQVETPRSAPSDGAEPRYTLLRLEIASVVVTDATGAEAVSVADLLSARPDRSAKSRQACCGIWTPSITTWWHGWFRSCPRRCDAGRPARSGSTGTVCGSASKATKATTTCGWPFTSRWTTCPGSARPSAC